MVAVIEASQEFQQWFSLGLGGLLITLVGYSIFKLIGAWMSLATTERHSSDESRERADVLQERLNEEIKRRVALEVEVRFLKKEINELETQVQHLVERLEAMEN
jgi:uncharacterized protein YlxW (UPF0749 family)